MGNVVAIVSVLLALVAAGSIAYIAWELTSEENQPSNDDEDEPPQKEP
ncbi:MAG: hypothetical protein HKN64_00540 [Woeseiaceae bacterium]|nr:hypothetical protein [Woeseiaceae bacterium]